MNFDFKRAKNTLPNYQVDCGGIVAQLIEADEATEATRQGLSWGLLRGAAERQATGGSPCRRTP
jgi:hypothetical protein